MDGVDIRWVRPDDAQGVAEVHVRTWRAAYQGLIADDVLAGLDVDDRRNRWTRWIQASMAGEPSDGATNPRHRMLVAALGEAVVGWATFGPGRDEGWSGSGELAGLYVLPEHWSRRVGHALISRVESELTQDGFASAYLWVLRGNDRAARFYESHGWVADGGEKVGSAGGAHDLYEIRHVRSLRPPEPWPSS